MALTAESMPAQGQQPSRTSSTQGLVALKVVRISSTAFSDTIMDQFMCAYLFPHALLVQWTCAMQEVPEAVNVSVTLR